MLALLLACASPKTAPPQDPAVEHIIEKYSGQVQYCYESALKDHPDLQGIFTVGIGIEQGQVTSTELERSTLATGSGVEDCARRKIMHWRFPEQMSEELSYTFTLPREPQGAAL